MFHILPRSAVRSSWAENPFDTVYVQYIATVKWLKGKILTRNFFVVSGTFLVHVSLEKSLGAEEPPVK
jgi:hypothetical protein